MSLHPAFREAINLARPAGEVTTRRGRTSSAPCEHGPCHRPDAEDWIETAQIWAYLAQAVTGGKNWGLRAFGMARLLDVQPYEKTVTDAINLAGAASTAIQEFLRGHRYTPPPNEQAATEAVHALLGLYQRAAEETIGAVKEGAAKVPDKIRSGLDLFGALTGALPWVAVALAAGYFGRRQRQDEDEDEDEEDED